MTISRTDTVIVVGFLILVQGTGALAGFWLPAIAPEVGQSLGLSPSLIAYPVLILYIFAIDPNTKIYIECFIDFFGPRRKHHIMCFIYYICVLLFLG